MLDELAWETASTPSASSCGGFQFPCLRDARDTLEVASTVAPTQFEASRVSLSRPRVCYCSELHPKDVASVLHPDLFAFFAAASTSIRLDVCSAARKAVLARR